MISHHPDTAIMKSLADAATKVMLGIKTNPEEEITEERPQEIEAEVLKEAESEDGEEEVSEHVELDDDVQAARDQTPGESSHKIELVLDGMPKNFLTTFDLSDPKFVKGIQEVVADKIREYQKSERV